MGAAVWMIRWRLGRGAAWAPLFVVTLAGVLVGGLLQAVGAVLSGSRLWRLHTGLREWSARLQAARDLKPVPWLAWGLLGLGAVAFAGGVKYAPVDLENDQKAFIALAKQIDHEGGLSALVRDLFVGGPGDKPGWYREANRHPFYPALHTVFSVDLTDLVASGRVVSSFAVCVAVLVLARRLARFEGDRAAWVFVVLCLANRSLFEASSTVACEGLLVCLVVKLWGDLTDADHDLWTGAHAFFAGFGCGAVWLTKGTGLLFLGGTLLWFWLWRWFGRRPVQPQSEVPASSPSTASKTALTLRWTVCFVVGWGVCASPLLVRNVREFGSPFHNVNSWLLFVDEFVDPTALSEQRTLGEQAREYVRTHSVGQMVRRAVSGAMWEGLILTRSLGPLPFQDGRLIPGAVLLAFAAVGLWARRDASGGLVVVWLVTQFPLYAWYVPVAAGDRFVTPLVGPLLVYAAVGVVRVGRILPEPSAATRSTMSPPTTA